MRVLLLGNSNDAGNWFEGGKKRHEIVAEQLQEEFGEPFEFTVKSLWPTEKLPKVVAGWIDDSEPDLIYISSNAYWFLYRSVPLRAKRLLGRFGGAAGTAGFAVANSKRWSHNAIFRTARRGLQATFGGDTNFTADQVIERISECTRIAVRREGVAVIVKGPRGTTSYASTPKGRARDEKTRQRVHRTLQSLCLQLHVTYVGADTPMFKTRDNRGFRVGDGLHSNAAGHVRDADDLYTSLRTALISAGHEPLKNGVAPAAGG